MILSLGTYTVIEPVKTVIDVKKKKHKTWKGAVTCYAISKSVVFHRLKGRDVLLELLGAKTEWVNRMKYRTRIDYPYIRGIKNTVEEFVILKNILTNSGQNIDQEMTCNAYSWRKILYSLKTMKPLQKIKENVTDSVIIYDLFSDLQKLFEECGFNWSQTTRFFNRWRALILCWSKEPESYWTKKNR